MKHVKMFGKSVPLIAIVLIGLLTIGGVSAVLLDYYGFIRGTAAVKQAVLVDGEGYNTPIDAGFTGVTAGDIVCRPHTLLNQASIPASVSFGTTITPAIDGITVKYLAPVKYSLATTAGGLKNDDVEIDVTDDGTSVTWTIDFPDQVGSGLKHVALIIALEGDGEGPAYQIHNTDNTEFTLTDGTLLVPGTWVVSPYYDDAWHSNDINTLVTALDWVTCSGERYSADGLYTISIDKSELGNDFHWALSLAIGSGGELIYEYMACPGPSMVWFNWGNPEVDMWIPNYWHATLAEEIVEPLILEPGVLFDFKICYTFPIDIAGDYTITTTVDVA